MPPPADALPHTLIAFRGLAALDTASVPELGLQIFGVEDPYQLPAGILSPGVFLDEGLGGVLLVVCSERPQKEVEITAVDPRGVVYGTTLAAADVHLLDSPRDIVNMPSGNLKVFWVPFHRNAALHAGVWRVTALVDDDQVVSDVKIGMDAVSLAAGHDPSPFDGALAPLHYGDTLHVFVADQTPSEPLTVVLYQIGPMRKETRLFALIPVVAGSSDTDGDGRLRLECTIVPEMPSGMYKIGVGGDGNVEIAPFESFTVEK